MSASEWGVSTVKVGVAPTGEVLLDLPTPAAAGDFTAMGWRDALDLSQALTYAACRAARLAGATEDELRTAVLIGQATRRASKPGDQP